MKSTKDFKKYLKNSVSKKCLYKIFSQSKKEEYYKYNNIENTDIPTVNNAFFYSQDERNYQSGSLNNFKRKDIKELKELNNIGNQRNSGIVYNKTESSSSFNNINDQNDEIDNYSYYFNKNSFVKNMEAQSLNKGPNYFRKINNIYESNYTHRHINTTSKSDLKKISKIPTDKNYRNILSNKDAYLKNKRQIQQSFNHNYNNNSLNYFNNNKISLNKTRSKEMTMERSHNKNYKYKKIIDVDIDYINNNISLNNLIINKKKDMNNRSLDFQSYDFLKRKNEEKEKLNQTSKYQNISKIINNKSMDSKKLLNKNNSVNSKNNDIINVNNGRIINLSNLNNFSYTTEKYNCYYENKRTTPNLTENKEKINTKNINSKNTSIKININDYMTQNNEKKENKKKNNNPNININPILFTKKYPKKENYKYPLRINYTSEKLNNALENESLMDYNYEKKINKKEGDSQNISKRSSKNIDKKDIFNSFNKGSNFQIKNMNKIENIKADKKIENSKNNLPEKNRNKDLEKNRNKEFEKNKDKNLEKNKNNDLDKNISKKNYFKTERIRTNDINGNKSLNKIKKSTPVQKNYNVFISGEKNEINSLNNTERNQDKKEYNFSGKPEKKIIYNNYTMNHNSLSFNPVKNEKQKNYILKIKNNDRIMIINKGNNNKNNSIENGTAPEKKRDRIYKISSHVVNEQFYKKNFLEEEINSSDDENILQMSMQSLNDSKIMEIANRYITDEENLDKNEVIEILNSKKDKN